MFDNLVCLSINESIGIVGIIVSFLTALFIYLITKKSERNRIKKITENLKNESFNKLQFHIQHILVPIYIIEDKLIEYNFITKYSIKNSYFHLGSFIENLEKAKEICQQTFEELEISKLLYNELLKYIKIEDDLKIKLDDFVSEIKEIFKNTYSYECIYGSIFDELTTMLLTTIVQNKKLVNDDKSNFPRMLFFLEIVSLLQAEIDYKINEKKIEEYRDLQDHIDALCSATKN